MKKKEALLERPKVEDNVYGRQPKATTTEHRPTIVLPKLNIQLFHLTLVGDTGLISHKWSEKAKKAMREKQTKRATLAKEARNPEEEFKDSLYEHPDGGYGFPAVAFKSAAVSACSHVSDITKVEARGAFHIDEELVKIEGSPVMREDMVRIAMGTATLRYRGEFKTWKARIVIRYNANVLSPEQIINLFDTAGFAIGVGEWRPEKDGRNGMFHVERSSRES